jgi:hypothetical protein
MSTTMKCNHTYLLSTTQIPFAVCLYLTMKKVVKQNIQLFNHKVKEPCHPSNNQQPAPAD